MKIGTEFIKVLKFQGIRLILFKIVYGFYWTPSRLFRLALLLTSDCWQCKSEEGDLVHVL